MALASAHDGRVVPCPADLTVDDACEEVVAHARRLGTPYGLVHAAGTVHARGEDPRVTRESEFLDFIALNLATAFTLTSAMLRAIPNGTGGSIVLLGSQVAHVGVPGYETYTAAKGGVTAMARSFAAEAGPDGVRVNVLPRGWSAPRWRTSIERISMTSRPGWRACIRCAGSAPRGPRRSGGVPAFRRRDLGDGSNASSSRTVGTRPSEHAGRGSPAYEVVVDPSGGSVPSAIDPSGRSARSGMVSRMYQLEVSPQSTRSSVPVIADASSEARNTNAAATSSGLTRRRIGTRANDPSRYRITFGPTACAVISVRVKPGETQLDLSSGTGRAPAPSCGSDQANRPWMRCKGKRAIATGRINRCVVDDRAAPGLAHCACDRL